MGTTIDQTLISDLASSLFATPRFIPARYHYDAKGSMLFEMITELDEYYLTRCEREILNNHKTEITSLVRRMNIIELGAGDGHKTIPLLHELVAQGHAFDYVPIDVSESSVYKLVGNLEHMFQNSCLHARGIVADYVEGLSRINQDSRHLILFLGSSIGNFEMGEASQFLSQLRHYMKSDDVLLVGFDLKKDVAILQRAYDDSKGITREFNLNVLDRLNREAGANFNRDKFQYHCFYNVVEGRVESWLVSKEPQRILIPALQSSFTLKAWEGIHMENSYKYTMGDIENLIQGAGYRIVKVFEDPQHYFACVALQLRGNHES